MHSSSSSISSLVRRFVAAFVLAIIAAFTLAPRAHALTAASLAAANLPGKTLRFTITGGNAPFETSGSFTVVFGQNGTYSMPISDGNATFRSGTYSVTTDSIGVVIRFDGYILNNATVEAVIIPTNDDQRSQFEMYTNGANKRGTVAFDTGVSGAPTVTSATTATATVGAAFTYTITTNPAATNFANAGGNAPVAINPTTGVVSGTFTAAGTFTFSFTASNASGSSAVTTVTVTVITGGTGAAPTISAQPAAQSASVGGSVTFSVTAAGAGLSYQWLFNNAVITGAINATYTIAQLTLAHAGSYSVRITGSGGTITSGAATLTVAPAGAPAAYLSNLSVRARAGSAAETLIVGVTIGGGTGTKSVLIRGIGPTLGVFGVGGVLADPVLSVYQGNTLVTTNDDWGNDSAIAATSVQVGAFALPTGSRDAAINATGVPGGGYTVQLTGKAGATGTGLIELYDTSAAATISSTSPRFTNLSARTFGGTASETLIVGFNVAGTGARRLVMRAVGPGLAAFGLGGTMADPKLELYNGNTKVAENDNWEASTLGAQQSVGAFALMSGSRDAVLVTTLAPGSYTVQVTGGTTGVALVEVYEAP